MTGAVRVDGRPLRRPALTLRPGLRIEVELDPARLPRREAVPAALTILLEDDVLLAVDKPPGLPTVPGADPTRPSLVALVKDALSARGLSPYVGVHQRLDRDTSGVVLFAKDRRANAGLAEAFAGRVARKTYHALTLRPERLPPASWASESPVDGAQAHTEFRRLRALPGGLLIEARPGTGRKHQIRIHLAAAGLPVLGDDRHGPKPARPAQRLMLHASCLELPHPLTGASLRIESPWPADFSQMLGQLERGGRT